MHWSIFVLSCIALLVDGRRSPNVKNSHLLNPSLWELSQLDSPLHSLASFLFLINPTIVSNRLAPPNAYPTRNVRDRLQALPQRTGHVKLSTSEDTSSSQSGTLADSTEPIDALQIWIRKQTLNTLLPREELIEAIREFRSDTDYLNRQRPTFDRIADKLEAQLRSETRSIGDLIGKPGSDRILKAFRGLDADADIIKAFLRTPAVEGVVGSLLYEGIFQFVTTVDLLGNIVNQLPIIGPIRQQVVQVFKQSLDQTLGKQVKSFLGSYSRAATEQLVSLVLAEQTSGGLADSRLKLGEEVLKRPVNTLVPNAATTSKLRDSAWALLQDQLAALESGDLINEFYERFGDQSLEGLGVEEVTGGPLRETSNRLLWRFLSSEEGKLFIEGAKAEQSV